ncbi:MAG: ElyC/SanA/YdcF family protein [Bacteroidales bacterium]
MEINEVLQAIVSLFNISSHIRDVKFDAVISMPGLGELERVMYAEEIRSKNRIPWLIISGMNEKEKTFIQIDPYSLYFPPFGFTNTDNIVCQKIAGNTRDQAMWVINQLMNKKIKKAILVTSPWHLLRNYMTTIKVIKDKKSDIKIYPIGANIPLYKKVPEYDKQGYEFIEGEINKIYDYQEKGHIISFKELKEYINFILEE